jgi:hypothetical protein
MRFWPGEKKRLQRIIGLFLFISLAAFSLLIILAKRVSNLSQSPPCSNLSSFLLETGSPACPQRIDRSGWSLKDNRLFTFPRCLTVMNSRFGSRFNLDWFFSDQKVTSGVLGTFEDQESHLTLRLKNDQGTTQLFPSLPNSKFQTISADLGLTYQRINFESPEFLVSLKITSPFSPTQSPEEATNKMNLAPFFYLELVLKNKTPTLKQQTISLTLAQAEKAASSAQSEIVYFKDKRGDGVRALAAPKNEKLTSFLKNKQGGFNWQTEVGPNSSQKTTLIYAGFLEGTVLTETRSNPPQQLKFAYNRYFKNVEEVIQFASENEESVIALTNQFEKTIDQKNLSPEVRWLMAQTFHSYLGNTWLVCDREKCQDFDYFVWEGRFKYLNTVDVAHDYAVLEGLYFPWVLTSELRNWQLAAKKDAKGTVIPHDLGHRFNLRMSQSYPPGDWRTSSMPVEENSNFILLAYWYWQRSQDNQFIKELTPFLHQLVISLKARDTNQNGIADDVIGITTYDNDGNTALQESPESSYLALKQLAAYEVAAKMFRSSGQVEFAQSAESQADLISRSLKKASDSFGFIPLSLDPTFTEKHLFEGKEIKGIEEEGFAFLSGLFYPALTGLDSQSLNRLLPALTKTYPRAYQKSLVKDKSSQNIGLQHGQYQALGLGWFSHSLMADFVAEKLLNLDYDSEEIFFPLLYDNPQSFADGYYFKEPLYPPQITLGFYPRGVTIFSKLVN